MWGGNDPDSRKPMIWSDIAYEDEMTNADGSQRSPDVVQANLSLRQHYKDMIKLRNTHPALGVGDYKTLLTDDENGIFAFQRHHEDENIWVLLNNSEQTQIVRIPSALFSSAKNLISLNHIKADKGHITFKVVAKSGAVFKVK
jgi:glycosidase